MKFTVIGACTSTGSMLDTKCKSFPSNVASTTDDGNGGGLATSMGNTFFITGELTLSNITVISNTASTGSLGSSGGGMSINAAGNSALNVEMTNVTVEENTAGNDFSSNEPTHPMIYLSSRL